MKKTISALLLLTIVLMAMPLGVYADVTVSIADTVTYSGDLVDIKFTISSNVLSTDDVDYEEAASSFALIFDAFDENNASVQDIQSCLQFVSVDLSGLPAGSNWECTTGMNSKTLRNRSSKQFNLQFYENVNNIGSTASIYEDRTGYVIITLRILSSATHSTISLKPSTTFKVSTYYGLELATSKSSSITLDLASQAPSDLTPTISVRGAQIRKKDPIGLRFVVDFTKDEFYEQFGITSNYSYSANSNDIAFGTLVALTSQLGEGELTKDSSCKKLDIPAEKILSEGSDIITYTGVIINFPADGSYNTTDFTCVAYVKVGTEYYYSSPVVRNFNQVDTQANAIMATASH